jgi:predicted GNAT family acetyltransferase
VQGALKLIRDDGLKVVAGCSFVVDYLRKHPEYADLMG